MKKKRLTTRLTHERPRICHVITIFVYFSISISKEREPLRNVTYAYTRIHHFLCNVLFILVEDIATTRPTDFTICFVCVFVTFKYLSTDEGTLLSKRLLI